MNACIYARTCQQEKRHHTTSIPRQVEIGRELAAEHNLTIQPDHIFTDIEFPGHLHPTCWALENEEGRPALAALIHEIEAGHVKRIIVRRIEKLGTASEPLQLLLELLERHDAYIVAPPEVATETTDPSAIFALGILKSRVQFETELARDRVERTRQKKREEIKRLKTKLDRLESELAAL